MTNALSLRPMTARDTQQHERAATALELLFDLVSVIAIAACAAGLHHQISHGHALQGFISFALSFFGIWWAWMNYTWFASAYDNDDTLFRLLTMVIMGGSLMMAAGISIFFDSNSLTAIVIGYAVMRVGMIALWLRAALHDTARRGTAIKYAIGIGIAQCFWIAGNQFQVTGALFYVLFLMGIIIELAVPLWAESKVSTPWHRHHIIERYGLLNIIVLGETLLAGSMALNEASTGEFHIAYVHIALSSMVILFSLWWLYFTQEDHLQRREHCFIWGYGHVGIFMSGAAVGAGFAVLVDVIAHRAHISLLAADFAVAIPVATYFLSLWFARDRLILARGQWVLPIAAVAVLVAPFVFGLEAVAAVAVATVIARSLIAEERVFDDAAEAA